MAGLTPPRPCGHEYHVRWWTDDAHRAIAQGNDAHGAAGQWVVGDPHHENRAVLGKHYIDRDWDQVRDIFLRYMSTYCHRRHFKYNAASYGNYQNRFHDGYIAALSLNKQVNGC